MIKGEDSVDQITYQEYSASTTVTLSCSKKCGFQSNRTASAKYTIPYTPAGTPVHKDNSSFYKNGLVDAYRTALVLFDTKLMAEAHYDHNPNCRGKFQFSKCP